MGNRKKEAKCLTRTFTCLPLGLPGVGEPAVELHPTAGEAAEEAQGISLHYQAFCTEHSTLQS